ncbi:MAG: TonB-dependent receptor, partial [Deltaproteobacteria bacterium]|nr:TonB-dependent receptor [Deltaproteobacteria bacterium]
RADEDLGNTERDYYHDTNISARVDGRISETVGVGFSVRYSESSMDLDGNDPVTYIFGDADEVQDTDITTISTNFDQDILDWWQQTIKFGTTETKREYTNDGAFNGTYKGTMKLASWQHNFFIGETDTVTAGFDYQEESGDGARHDDHQTFGGEDTYKGAIAYLYEKTGTKVRGSYGTGFHAPSLYQLYDPTVGDRNLKPEESRGYDVGIDQELFGNKVYLSIAYFHNKIEDLIEWQYTGPGMYDGQYFNIGKAKTKGWETSFSLKPLTWLSFDAHYTYTEAKDETEGGTNEGKYLIYRSKHTGGASVNIKPLEKLNVNLNAQYVGKRYRTADNIESMPAYTLYNLAASYDVMEWLKIFGRVENLTDKKYQSIYQYGEPGIGFYGGVKVTF